MLRCKLDRRPAAKLTTAFLARFGLTRNDKARGLAALEGAGLIRVERRFRSSPTVTPLPVSEEDCDDSS